MQGTIAVSASAPAAEIHASQDARTAHAPADLRPMTYDLNYNFVWLYFEGEADANPMARIKRPRRPRPEDVEVVIVTPADVERMLAACDDWQEFLCLSVLAYTGARRD